MANNRSRRSQRVSACGGAGWISGDRSQCSVIDTDARFPVDAEWRDRGKGALRVVAYRGELIGSRMYLIEPNAGATERPCLGRR